MMRKRFRGQAGRPSASSRLARAQRGAMAMGMMAFTGRQPRMTQRDFRAGTAMGMMAATGGRFRNQIGGSVPTCPFIGDLFWDISGGQGVVHPVYNAWREQRIANGQDTEVISWAQETGCYPAMGAPASDQNIVVAQWGGQNDYIAPNDIQQALAIYEGSGVSGGTSGVTSGKKPAISKRPRSSSIMKGVTGRDDCGFVRQSGFTTDDAFDSGGLGGLLDYLGAQDPYQEAFAVGGSSALLDALAGQTTAPYSPPNPEPTFLDGFLDSLADPNDISSGEFGGVDSLLDDLQSTTLPATAISTTSAGIYGGSTPMSALSSGDGFTPVISGGGDGMPPPMDFSDGRDDIIPVISGGGDGMPPPPPVMSGGGDGMPPPPVMSGGGDGMPPPIAPAPRRRPMRRPKPSRVARAQMGLM